MSPDRNFDSLEMQLRALGRRLDEPVRPQAITAARARALQAIHTRNHRRAATQGRRVFVGLVVALLATLPVPVLFLWADWTTASRLFDWLLPSTLSQYLSYGYLWVKVCSLAIIYGLGIPALLWAGARTLRHQPQPWSEFEEVASS